MGVPKFFRWIAERYPMVITPFRDFPPPVDNLYLDVNGIIHNCSHPNDANSSAKVLTEKEMIEAMFVYLEKLFHAIQPRKCFFLAVDGVAPRAKMNQQRQRRYRSGYEMMVARERAAAEGMELLEENVFDSNCITPGTEFMVNVSEHLKYFIMMKVSSDPAWQSCKVVYSGHDHPGEGEHKIVDYIRRRKMQEDYNPNETHSLYGLDADLILLALATHEPHLVLLREVVSFGPSQGSRADREQRENDEANGIVADKTYNKPDEFVLFHVNILRNYLDLEVRYVLGGKLPAGYDLEHVIDDFVFMCIFIGNDFLPSIPTLGIRDGSVVKMVEIYATKIVKNGRRLTEDGSINWDAVDTWLQELAKDELPTIKSRALQERAYQSRMARMNGGYEAPNISTETVETLVEYKEKYYREKHGFGDGWNPQGENMAKLKLHYVEGIAWVLEYYYQGPPSWKWFYPHHYAPMASDLVDLAAVASRVRFDPGEPFLPHQQLLAVLPPMSYRLVPRAYWPLLRSKGSPLAKYFPEKLQIDREGARAEWEGVVLIPFIDERVLLAAYESVQSKVTPEDRKNNSPGPPILFTYDATAQPFDVPNKLFPRLKNVMVHRCPFEFPPKVKFIPKLCEGVHDGQRQLEGFTTLWSKLGFFTPQRALSAVAIFGRPSRDESLLLELKDSFNCAGAMDGATLVGQEVLVGFPHYRRARVVSVCDQSVRVYAKLTSDGAFCGTSKYFMNGDDSARFKRDCDIHMRYMREKLGVSVVNLRVLVYVNIFVGMRVTPEGRVVRNFSTKEKCYALPLIARLQDADIVDDYRYIERDRLDEDNVLGTRIIYVGPEPKSKKGAVLQVYGSPGTVIGTNPEGGDEFTVVLRAYVDNLAVPQSLRDYASRKNWMSAFELSDKLGASPLALCQLAGSLRVAREHGSREIGLGIIYTRNNLVRIGYAKVTRLVANAWKSRGGPNRRLTDANYNFGRSVATTEPLGHYTDRASDDSDGRPIRMAQSTIWFSSEAVGLIKQYVQKFRPLVDLLGVGAVDPQSVEPERFMTGSWEGGDISDVINEISTFVGSLGISDVPLVSGGDDAFPQSYVELLERELEKHSPRARKEVVRRPVPRRYLYFPTVRHTGGYIVQLPFPRNQVIHLGSRVVNCRACGAVPFGATGTVVRLVSSGTDAEVVYDEPFLGGVHFDGRLKTPRGALSKTSTLLVLGSGDGSGDQGTLMKQGQTSSNMKKFTPKPNRTERVEAGPSGGVRVTVGVARGAERVSASTHANTTCLAPQKGFTMGGSATGINMSELMGKLSLTPST
uniref:5'-3' exoribonuclease 2 n=1 Tax=Trypanosoma congolense (strain IL3000) TaxID=1068625 RepID=G0UQD3_TRYCI|nr:putative exoribonuclease 1 [Trypanosoma congolense IL3000]